MNIQFGTRVSLTDDAYRLMVEEYGTQSANARASQAKEQLAKALEGYSDDQLEVTIDKTEVSWRGYTYAERISASISASPTPLEGQKFEKPFKSTVIQSDPAPEPEAPQVSWWMRLLNVEPTRPNPAPALPVDPWEEMIKTTIDVANQMGQKYLG